MKNKKNRFIAIIILFIVFIIGLEMYKTFIVSGIDRNSYVILSNGEAILNNNKLILGKKEKLKAHDKIETIGEESLAIIKWGDGSITRLGGNSSLIIKESQIDRDLLNIKIAFFLEKGKTWSDVISFIGEDSYFHQSFADTTAAVRGTIFEVNLDKDYVYVEKHEISLTKKSGEKKIVPEKKPFVISKFSFTELMKFINEMKDKTWQNLNIKLDKEFYEKLRKNFKKLNDEINKEIIKYKKQISDLDSLTQEQKDDLYDKLLGTYQKIKFISPDDINNYKTKLELKEDLIKISDDKNKQNLLISSIYDIKELAYNKNIEDLAKNFKILSDNKALLGDLNIDFESYINMDLFKNLQIPEGLQNEFQKSFDNIKGKLNLNSINSEGSVTDSLKNSFEKSVDHIKNNIGNITDLIDEK